MGKWIWLPCDKYENNQTTYFNSLDKGNISPNYTVCSIKKRYEFDKISKSAEIVVSADTAFLLFCNGTEVVRGPAYSGGDFLDNDKARSDYYALKLKVDIDAPYIEFCALVRLMPYHICEYSKGQGGFFLDGTVLFENGEKTDISSDETWEITKLNSYTCPGFFDGRRKSDAPVLAEVKNDIWDAKIAPIMPCAHSVICSRKFTVCEKESIFDTVKFERVYAGHFKIKATTNGTANVKVTPFEFDVKQRTTECVFVGSDSYYSLELTSVGGFDFSVTSLEKDCVVEIIFEDSYYPILKNAKQQTSDSELNNLLDVCAHTLKYCRQLHHLDSPLHCEPLACVGDYYIEMLMTMYSFGDTSLCEFDLARIAHTIKERGGRLFHTTYSLIWVKMLYECYLLRANTSLLRDCKEALDLLFELFDSYIGENSLIEAPPDYMFVDWLFPDGISTHHPPKALGQSCLNMFYYGALCYGEKIYHTLGDYDNAKKMSLRASKIKSAIKEHLYCKEKGLFFEGLNTKTPDEMVYQYLPQNVEKRYFRKHANILACYFGIVENEEARQLLEKVYTDTSLGEVQPYFMHFWFGAVYNNGLCKKYTLPLLKGWKDALRKCPVGLPEGFYPPEPTYKFDYSHAWGGTPLYSLPQAICGLEIKEAGYKKISLNIDDLGLDFFRLEIPTPYGEVLVEGGKNKETKITAPREITII